MGAQRGFGGLLHSGSSLVLEAVYYDTILSDLEQPAALPLDQSPWWPIYDAAEKLIDWKEPVIDLGCGSGLFAQMLAIRGHQSGYWGYDFSSIAIEQAQQLGLKAQFEIADLRKWQVPRMLSDSIVFVCLEVLEHLDDDRDLVARIPPGHRLVGTVPNFDSEAHVRSFSGPGAIWERYSHLLMFRRWQLLDLDTNGRAIHLFEGIRRNESWE